jgi:cyclophilin family peptidyl-prolyl cis-trans isomerase
MKHTKVISMAALAAVLFLTACSGSKKITAPPVPEPPKTSRLVLIETSFGNMVVALSDSTPQHRDNFVKLVEQGFYDSLLFHRVINTFMIQGGDPDSKRAAAGVRLGNGSPGYRVPAEFNTALFHKRGVIAAARDGNPEKASSGCQFYIVHGKKYTDAELDQVEIQKLNGRKIPPHIREVYKTIGGSAHLDMGYTVFGELIAGHDVIDKIAAVAKDGLDRPFQDIRMFMKMLR